MSIEANRILVWVSIIGGTCAILGTLVGAGMSYGHHMQADTDQDALLRDLRQDLKTFDARIEMLERAHDDNHQRDVALFVPHKEPQ